ncbi:hypothetical protein OG747_51090 (plasmid) [Streptomyces sp. NBC_01384]|uniref:hypothetical protein n=1 Tax=Streptomyces sp. NBC_01384 TaxID=2903847 RepID=UPI002F918FBD
MDRFRTAAVVALPLLLPLLAAAPASAAEPAPLPLGSVRSVRPGDTLAVTAASGQAANGDTITSPALLKAGRMRMTAPGLTATVTIACDARPGTYPVTLTSAGAARPAEHGAPWARVRVEPADEAARRACRDKVKKMPPPDREEHWAANTTWPQSEWDVRSFRAGSRITITDNDDEGLDGVITLSSPSFADQPVLRGARAVLTATATLRCDAAPGLYPVYRHAPDQGKSHPNQPWARLRIAPASRTSTCPAQQAARPSRTSLTEVAGWAAGGVLLAAAAAGTALLLKRFRSRRADTAGTPPRAGQSDVRRRTRQTNPQVSR